MIQYSGGTLINRLFNPVTRQDWVNNVTQALSDAGWTTISGTPGSGSDVKLETAAQNAGCKMRFRFLEPGSGACAQVTMKNVTETATSAIAYCLPSAGIGLWRIVANKYQFFAFASGNSNTTPNRCSVFGGTLWTPTFLGLSSSDSVGWMEFAGVDDPGSGAQRTSWRITMRLQASGLNPPAYHVMFQGNSFGAGASAGGIGAYRFLSGNAAMLAQTTLTIGLTGSFRSSSPLSHGVLPAWQRKLGSKVSFMTRHFLAGNGTAKASCLSTVTLG